MPFHLFLKEPEHRAIRSPPGLPTIFYIPLKFVEGTPPGIL
jgi:hypothetical protein